MYRNNPPFLNLMLENGYKIRPLSKGIFIKHSALKQKIYRGFALVCMARHIPIVPNRIKRRQKLTGIMLNLFPPFYRSKRQHVTVFRTIVARSVQQPHVKLASVYT